MSAGLPPTKQIIIHGFITVGGEKMSKSVGNVIDPIAIVDEYGVDALRYYLARHIHPFEDSDFTMEKFKEAYNADLANGIGNLVARIMQLSSQYLQEPPKLPRLEDVPDIHGSLNNYNFNDALFTLKHWTDHLNELINEQRTFDVVKSERVRGEKQLNYLVTQLGKIAVSLEPFMPDTARKIQEAIRENKKPTNLFPRKE